MKKFRFPLQTVLKLRARQEREARLALGRAQGDLARIRQREELLDAALRHAEAEASAGKGAEGLAAAYAGVLEDRRRALALERSQASARVNAARQHWLRARAGKRSLETLRDLRREEHRQIVERAWQTELEELAAGPRIDAREVRR